MSTERHVRRDIGTQRTNISASPGGWCQERGRWLLVWEVWAEMKSWNEERVVQAGGSSEGGKSKKASEKGIFGEKQQFPFQRQLDLFTSHRHQTASKISHILCIELPSPAATQTPSLTAPGCSWDSEKHFLKREYCVRNKGMMLMECRLTKPFCWKRLTVAPASDTIVASCEFCSSRFPKS